MLTFRVRKSADIAGLAREIEAVIDRVGQSALRSARSNTPVRSGRARAGWELADKEPGWRLNNQVPYIERLDRGWSKQAPRGMSKPVLGDVRRAFARSSTLKSGRLTR